MASLATLYDQEDSCRARIAELERRVDTLTDARAAIMGSTTEVLDQLSRKIAATGRAADVSGTRLGRRYAERMGDYLRGTVSRGISDSLDEARRRVDDALARAEEELDAERARLRATCAQIEDERARQRAEREREEREARERAAAQQRG